jgi:hypothetical protein
MLSNRMLVESLLVRLPDGNVIRADRTRQEPVELFRTEDRAWMSNGHTRRVGHERK